MGTKNRKKKKKKKIMTQAQIRKLARECGLEKTARQVQKEFEEDFLTLGPEELINKYQLDGVDDIF